MLLTVAPGACITWYISPFLAQLSATTLHRLVCAKNTRTDSPLLFLPLAAKTHGQSDLIGQKNTESIVP